MRFVQKIRLSNVTSPSERFVWWTLMLVFLVYGLIFIWRTSFVIDGERYFSLFDDAMISMRYAKNLAEGFGLVWNPGGDSVEGFTNPLWTAYMVFLHGLNILPVSKISLLVQLSGLVFLVVNLALVRKIAALVSMGNSSIVMGAVFLTAFYLPLNNWSLQGMEVSILTLIMSWVILLSLQSIKKQQFHYQVYLLLGVSTLIRLDMLGLSLAVLVFFLVFDKRFRNRHFWVGLFVLAMFTILQVGWRWWYFGELLPNTYYLKMTGYPTIFRISRGIYVAMDFIWKMNWVLFLSSVSYVLFKRERGLLFLLWLFLTQLAYSIYVGGDAWEWWGGSNRYLSIVMPGLFVVMSCVLVGLGGFLHKVAKLDKGGYRFILVGLFVASCLSLNSLRGPQSLIEWLLIKPPLHVESNREIVEQALLIKDITYPEAKVAVVWAGALPYFMDREAIDLLGKSDKFIARLPMRISDGLGRWIGFYPGHLKYDYGYSIGELKPDIVAHLWKTPEESAQILGEKYSKVEFADGVQLYLLNNSVNINNVKLREFTNYAR